MKDNVKSLLKEAISLSVAQSILFDDLDLSHETDEFLVERGYDSFMQWESPQCCYNSILKKLHCAFLILLLKEDKIMGSLENVRSLSFENVLFSSGHYNREKTEKIFYSLYETIENAYGFHTEVEHLCYEENQLRTLRKMLGKSKRAIASFEEAREYIECSVYGEAYYCFSDHTYDKEKSQLYGLAENSHYSAYSIDGLKRRGREGKYMLYSIVPTFVATNGYYDIDVELHGGWYFSLHSLLAKILISVG